MQINLPKALELDKIIQIMMAQTLKNKNYTHVNKKI